MPQLSDFTKTRQLPHLPDTLVVRGLDGSTTRSRLNSISGVQLTASIGNPWFVKPRPEGDVGSEFTSVKVEVVPNSWTWINSPGKPGLYNFKYNGPALPVSPSGLFNYTEDPTQTMGFRFSNFPDLSSSDNFLMAQGTVAVDRCKPTNSVASVATTLGELRRDGIPSLPGLEVWRNKTDLARGAGSEYLNYQFGWKPLVNDIRNFAKAASQSSKILSQLERDSGRQVRRRYDFPLERRIEDLGSVTSNLYPSLSKSGYVSGELTSLHTIREIETRRWFTGAFTYYIPKGDSFISRVARGFVEFDKLYGGVTDPEIIWNLTPWSWATDWFLNTGSVISNLSDAANYGLVMPYGYIMEQTSVTYTYRATGPVFYGVPERDYRLKIVHTTKKRRKATPFGFGLTWEGFDPYQLSILAALGITRKPHH